MRLIKPLFLSFLSSIFAAVSFAGEKDVIEWSTTNIQLLRGHNFELGEKHRTIVTLEHANRWAYGDFFGFAEAIIDDNGDATYYAEPTLRVSTSKVFNTALSNGLIKDVFIAAQIEVPENRSVRFLGGVGFDLNVPTFTYLKVNLFMRDNPDVSGTTYQTNIAWNRPFKVGTRNFLAEGFADIVGAEGTLSANQLIVPRLLMDVSDFVSVDQKKIWLGVEWQYWHNKFGVNGVTESAPQLQLKYVF